MPEWLGKTIGKVRIDKHLARGGMGEVYLGSHLTLDRLVAVKVLHSFIEEDHDLLMRFQREARVVAGLRHPNIVQIYDFDTIDGHPYLVMEYLNGPPLSVYLKNLHKRNERIPHVQVARLLKSLTAALDYAHDLGVIHRDIKSGNIMLHGKAGAIPLDSPITNDAEAVVMDFGLVRIVNTASQSISGMVTGTPAYMSPEQARGEKTDRRTDIYSLGIVLYEMLAGRVPFEADSNLSLIYKQIHEPPPPITGITPEVQKVIDRALAKKPDERYPTAGSMADDFLLAVGMAPEVNSTLDNLSEKAGRILGDIAVTSPEPASTFVKPKPAVRKPTRIGLGVLSIIGLLALTIGGVFLFSRLSSSNTLEPSVSPNATQASNFTIATEDHNTESITPTADIAPSEAPGLPDADGMVEISSGTYEVGAASADQYHSVTMNIFLNNFWIDKYQVTFEKYQQFMVATGTGPPDILGKGNHPVRGITWDQAVAYCIWANKRLPTEAEWEAAGRGPGPNPQLYPWGNDPKAGGDVASLPDQDTYEVGTLPFNKSPYEVYDMVGNVWEWVGEPYANTPAGSKILRGGRFGLPILELSYRLPASAGDARYLKYAGFRCAADQVK